MPAPIYDVAIAGGSHVGLSLALALVELLGRDVRVGVVERASLAPGAASNTKDPRAFSISAGSKNLLDAIGVWSRIADKAEPVRSIEITDSALEHAVRPVLLGYVPILARSFWYVARPQKKLDLKQIGWSEVVYSVIFLIAAGGFGQ